MSKHYRDCFKTLLSSKKGQGMVEYGLIIALIAVVVIVGITLLGGNLNTLFNNMGTKVNVTVP